VWAAVLVVGVGVLLVVVVVVVVVVLRPGLRVGALRCSIMAPFMQQKNRQSGESTFVAALPLEIRDHLSFAP
jgi:hypothetical protein